MVHFLALGRLRGWVGSEEAKVISIQARYRWCFPEGAGEGTWTVGRGRRSVAVGLASKVHDTLLSVIFGRLLWVGLDWVFRCLVSIAIL
jgi:hypothetical protein